MVTQQDCLHACEYICVMLRTHPILDVYEITPTTTPLQVKGSFVYYFFPFNMINTLLF